MKTRSQNRREFFESVSKVGAVLLVGGSTMGCATPPFTVRLQHVECDVTLYLLGKAQKEDVYFQTLQLHFSKPIREEALKAIHFDAKDGAVAIKKTLDVTHQEVMIEIQDPLEYGVNYVLKVDSTLRSEGGESLNGKKAFHFKTTQIETTPHCLGPIPLGESRSITVEAIHDGDRIRKDFDITSVKIRKEYGGGETREIDRDYTEVDPRFVEIGVDGHRITFKGLEKGWMSFEVILEAGGETFSRFFMVAVDFPS